MSKSILRLTFPYRACCRETSAHRTIRSLYTWPKRHISTRASVKEAAYWIKEKFTIDVRALAKEHGPGLLVFYFFFNQFCLLTFTTLFHFGYLSTAAVRSLLGYVGLDRFLPNESPKHDGDGVPQGDAGNFWAIVAMEYAFSSVIVSILTPVQIPLCLSLWPYMRSLFKLVRR
ncbi:FAD-dependent pyridine nucleotide-disulfide oxidoreductase [Perkinsela sp. CCAP 1560/4]|nr:FAD-dependent pyridine nucleotide-disulfide oxidoreductase [Perkinsela sp. CCAP 1560/4]|eukprot:KNH09495.1 FAD-dependent pyridine nucleotide-disulfide oxidoreductase [Perkinsela sp. CCAP 1560/4]